MTRLIPGVLVVLMLCAWCAGAAAAADVRAEGHGALLPSGGVAGATATADATAREASAAGVRPAGGGYIASLGTHVSVTDGGADGAAAGRVEANGVELFQQRVTIGALRMSVRVEAGPGGPEVTLEETVVEGLVVNGEPVTAGPGSRVQVDDIGTLVFFERADVQDGVRVNALRVEVTDPAARELIGEPFVLGHLELAAAPGAPPSTEPPSATTAPRHAAPAPTRTSPREPDPTPRSAPRPDAPERPSTDASPSAPRDRPSPLIAPEPEPLSPLPRREAPGVDLDPGDGYVFPVFGDVGFTDDYLAPRAGTGRHYGNDLFADTGTPVVAVADGRLSKVGVNTLGGNRLWLTDDRGNWFYYAHMSAYAPATVDGARVERGQVIGFVGNSGQAITTPPHLHFEIRPGGIDGEAINPYPHLLAWQRGADIVPRAFREGGSPAEPTPAVGAVIVDWVPERDAPPGPGGGMAVPVG